MAKQTVAELEELLEEAKRGSNRTDYLCLRNCFVGVQLWKAGKVYTLPEEMEKHPKNFRLVGASAAEVAQGEEQIKREAEEAKQARAAKAEAKQKPKPEVEQKPENPLVCSVCQRECKSKSGLKSHMRSHKEKS